MSNLQLRTISAIVLAAAVLGLTWVGGLPFRLLSAAIVLAIFFEWSAMSRPRTDSAWAMGGLGILPEVAVLLFAGALVAGVPALALIGLVAVFTLILWIVGRMRGVAAWEAAGFGYAALSGLSLALLRGNDASGLVAILFLFAVVWATDIFAYFVGRKVGGPKLAPAISPGKTRSGALGGAVGGVVAGLLLAGSAGSGSLPLLAAVALLLSVISQAGDLFESWVKRRHGYKDSGSLIPGHGGVMDRVDGLVAAAFALYVIGWLSGSADHPAQGLFPA
ncbi:phosphatidate cytidylyltransferase [Aminobacter sp. DSM 101952]|uniref:phosphatidate cytidylyltransferase n=1 Tax=Aminobacter sp. DSM 101952 TaxID=2735891 RepID=UPI0006F904BA|nr:phosphatidate cytidylyltransferase [Aminobacter sp. DSM 101952]KQU69923.1 phosphatidate cytidylyltransferase [Aminobacter sp. DSM 101952]